MAKKGKNIIKAYEKFDSTKDYSLTEGVKLLKDLSFAKFDETVDIVVRLGVDPRHADQNVRGAVVMPAGLGKSVRVMAFCQGENETLAKDAGADYVGGQEFVNKIKGGWMEFDVVVATPDMMRFVGQIGRVLGPRGMMPNPKTGTVTSDIAAAVKEMKAGKVQFRVDKMGNLHAPTGKVSFSVEKLEQNIMALLDNLKKIKPVSAKGTYMKKIVISSTMGPSINIDPSIMK